MEKRRDPAYGEYALRQQWWYEDQAGRYQDMAGKAETKEQYEALMRRAKFAVEKADYWEAERMY